MSFPNRPQQKEGESFSSYLMRLAKANGILLNDLKHIIFDGLDINLVRGRGMPQLDVLPQRIIDIEKTKKLIGRTDLDIEKMSFTAVFHKFYKNPLEDKSIYVSVLAHQIIKKNRRFCTSCLKEDSFFKLEWQIKELSICDKHMEFLQDKCNVCGTGLPYELPGLICPACTSDLTVIKKLHNPSIDEVYDQKKKYSDWIYLMDADNNLAAIDGYSVQQTLAFLIYYNSSISETKTGINRVRDFNNISRQKLLNIILQPKKTERIAVITLLKLTRTIGIPVKQLMKSYVPDEFIINIEYIGDEHFLGICLSPWCISKGSDVNMVSLTDNDQRYVKQSICKDCYVKHGFDRYTVTWQNMHNSIESILLVKTKLEEGLTVNMISKVIGMDYYNVCKHASYVYNNEVLSKNIDKPRITIPDNVVNCFIKLSKHTDSMRNNAKKNYGWNAKQFYYYLAIKDVQDALINTLVNKNIESYISNTRSDWFYKVNRCIGIFLTEGKKITIPSIAKAIGCSDNVFYRYALNELIVDAAKKQSEKQKEELQEFLIKKVDLYVLNRSINLNKISKVEIFRYLKRTRSWVAKTTPNLMEHMSNCVAEYNANIDERKLQHFQKLLVEVLVDLHMIGTKITREVISIKTRTPLYHIKSRPYAKIINSTLLELRGKREDKLL